mgnify:CR=1 FL=1
MTPMQRVVFVLGTTLAVCAGYAGYLLQTQHNAREPTAAATPAPVTEPRLWYHQSIRSPGLR